MEQKIEGKKKNPTCTDESVNTWMITIKSDQVLRRPLRRYQHEQRKLDVDLIAHCDSVLSFMCSAVPVGPSNKRVGRHMRCCLGTSTICVASAWAGMQGMQQHVMPISPEGGNRSVDMQQKSLLSERQHPEWSQHPTVRGEFSSPC